MRGLSIAALCTLLAPLACAAPRPADQPTPTAPPQPTEAPRMRSGAGQPQATPAAGEEKPAKKAKKSAKGAAQLRINGELVEVRWSDGDSFKFKTGPYAGAGVRLTDYNTLESYGPVHRWGAWTAAELYALARDSKNVAAAGVWSCVSDGTRDRYGRVLVSCPDAALAMIRAGHALVFGVDAAPAPELLSAQKEAQAARAGMWAKGVPEVVVTSLHSAAEEGEPYNRVADLRAGLGEKRPHAERYQVCQEVCVGEVGPDKPGSCMVYVPYEQRYRNKPPCLRTRRAD